MSHLNAWAKRTKKTKQKNTQKCNTVNERERAKNELNDKINTKKGHKKLREMTQIKQKGKKELSRKKNHVVAGFGGGARKLFPCSLNKKLSVWLITNDQKSAIFVWELAKVFITVKAFLDISYDNT